MKTIIRKKRGPNKYKKPNLVDCIIHSKITECELEWVLEQATINEQTISKYIRLLIKKQMSKKSF